MFNKLHIAGMGARQTAAEVLHEAWVTVVVLAQVMFEDRVSKKLDDHKQMLHDKGE